MAHNSTYNILMYSHDTYGLGHVRRTMAIASHLRQPGVNILILTGSPIVGRFSFPEQIDFVRIPGMIKKTNDEYLPLSIHINPRHAMEIRQRIITATAKAFRPHLFIVDKEPLGLKREVLPTLEWIRHNRPKTRTILGLRDIMDDAATVRQDWGSKGVYDILENLYSELWVYGQRELYDPLCEYAIPETIWPKTHFTGYIPRQTPGAESVQRVRREHLACNGHDEEKLVVVTAGGGGDGYPLMDTFLAALEERPAPFRSVLITGPFMPDAERKALTRRARLLGVRTHHFFRHMERIFAAADLVVSMAGYNTVCEILSQGTVALLVPRETPRREQSIRAEILSRRHLAEYIPWNALCPRLMRQKIELLLEQSEPYREAMAGFALTGLRRIRARLKAFRCHRE
jgi:predicted glycosyltransferase